MARRILVSFVAVGAFIFVMAALPPADAASTPAWESGLVRFKDPVKVLDRILQGDYVIVHDPDRMARGKPCTSIYEFRGSRPGKEVVAFHCKPQPRATATKLIVTIRREPFLGSGFTLVDYQFAGSNEAHGVPGVR